MRLICANTKELREFSHSSSKQYAILSHRWRDEEITFQDLSGDMRSVSMKKGYQKLESACRQATRGGFRYIWVDTCCMNKDSSAELSEAINSMYRWYHEAEVCYAYLFDVPDGVDPHADPSAKFANSEWFRRGWTLQELVAPRKMVFFSQGWKQLGTKASLKDILAKITGIGTGVLDGTMDPMAVSVATRMSWAASRHTSRPEDEAYSLMGLFNVNMPMLYGEGSEKAFIRLQEHIMEDSDDESIFAWINKSAPDNDLSLHGLLAPSSRYFAHSGGIQPYCSWDQRSSFRKTNKGLRISLNLTRIEGNIYIAAINCSAATNHYSGYLGVFLKRLDGPDEMGDEDEDYRHYARIRIGSLPFLESRGTMRVLYVHQNAASVAQTAMNRIHLDHILQLWQGPSSTQGYTLVRTSGTACSAEAAVMLGGREWIGVNTSVFLLPKGVEKTACVLEFEREWDKSHFNLCVYSTADFGIVFDVQEITRGGEIEQERNTYKPKTHPGQMLTTDRESIRVDAWPLVKGGRKYYIIDIVVTLTLRRDAQGFFRKWLRSA
ncbi:het domain-containing protein [Diplodia corticola]|uniref:Het domain-containing protein n=1 Tax=Diplodia corticola TaxID=236234 RepID=A0A1J9S412_9PEZI|nr:het domain-containing protein [Diplodia corticola]OJD35279.1 het domain-containing protein [Diplodia corticola]